MYDPSEVLDRIRRGRNEKYPSVMPFDQPRREINHLSIRSFHSISDARTLYDTRIV